MPNEGGQEGDGEESSEGEGGLEEGTYPSAEGDLNSNGELPEGDPEDVESNQEGEPGELSPLPGSLLPGTDESDGDSGWEVSNQLPETGGGSSSDEDAGVAALPGEFEQVDGEMGSAVEGALQRALEAMDGEILGERNDDKDRAGDRAATSSGHIDELELKGLESEEDGEGDGPNTELGEEEDGLIAGDRTNDQQHRPPGPMNAIDTPDARDNNVVARQLREAAMAETDPELKAELWEEYRKYVDGNK